MLKDKVMRTFSRPPGNFVWGKDGAPDTQAVGIPGAVIQCVTEHRVVLLLVMSSGRQREIRRNVNFMVLLLALTNWNGNDWLTSCMNDAGKKESGGIYKQTRHGVMYELIINRQHGITTLTVDESLNYPKAADTPQTDTPTPSSDPE